MTSQHPSPPAEPWPAAQMWLIHLTYTSQAPTQHTALLVQVPCAPGAISWFHEHMFLHPNICACICAFSKHLLCTSCGLDTVLGERDIKTTRSFEKLTVQGRGLRKQVTDKPRRVECAQSNLNERPSPGDQCFPKQVAPYLMQLKT